MEPLLAPSEIADVYRLKYPVMVSPKIDGIRWWTPTCGGLDGKPVSRKIKPWPNRAASSLFTHDLLRDLDGEMVSGSITAPDACRVTNSILMSHHGRIKDLCWNLFDDMSLGPEVPFSERYAHLLDRWRTGIAQLGDSMGRIAATSAGSLFEETDVRRFHLVSHFWAYCPEEVLFHEERWLEEGYEGLMIRDPDAPYKLGRSTLGQAILLKLKRFEDAEFEVIGFEPLQHNTNTAVVDERGLTKRSSAAAGLVADPTKLGKLLVRVINGPWAGTETAVSNFVDRDRVVLMALGSALLGRVGTLKYFAGPGSKEAPRFPHFKCWRNTEVDG